VGLTWKTFWGVVPTWAFWGEWGGPFWRIEEDWDERLRMRDERKDVDFVCWGWDIRMFV